MSFFSELKRRNVVRMAVLYTVAGWVLLQIADVLFDQLGVPPWAFRLVFGLLILGFPLALIFSWVFELTPKGLRRTEAVAGSHSIVEQTGRRMNLLIVGLLAVAIAMLAADRFLPDSSQMPREATAVDTASAKPQAAAAGETESQLEENSIAVLPFVNMSGDPENEYFSDGLSEELLNTLVRVGGLKVTGRTSSFAFRGDSRDLREIGDILDVAHVLEGSVRKAGNRVRITAQLVETSDGFHLWSNTFDRELDDIFAVQQEIAEEVTAAMHVTLLGDGGQRPSKLLSAERDPRAYEEYLRGMYIWQREPDRLDSLNRARARFEKALGIHPDYFDAYWGMFLVWDRMNRNGHVPFTESYTKLQELAEELKRLDTGSDRTLSAAARIALLDFDYQRSADYLEEASKRFPASVKALAEYANVLAVLTRYDEAIEMFERAMRLDPLSLEVMRIKSRTLLRAGDCEGVEDVMHRALEIEPDVGRFRYYLAMCIFETTGDVDAALPFAEAEPLSWAQLTGTAILLEARGDKEEAQRRMQTMMEQYGDAAAYQYGQIYAQWGQLDFALDWLETAIKIRDPGIVQANADRLLAPLSDEPRFERIMRDAGHR